jgi:hypothetical protein
MRTPNSAARRWRMLSSSEREIAEKLWPRERMAAPRWKTSIELQRANVSTIAV